MTAPTSKKLAAELAKALQERLESSNVITSMRLDNAIRNCLLAIERTRLFDDHDLLVAAVNKVAGEFESFRSLCEHILAHIERQRGEHVMAEAA